MQAEIGERGERGMIKEALQGALALAAVGALVAFVFWKVNRWRAFYALLASVVLFGVVDDYRLKNDPAYAAKRRQGELGAEQSRLARAKQEKQEAARAVVALIDRQPTAPNYKTVLTKLGDRFTQSQRHEYFDIYVKGKIASWRLTVDDVELKTFGGVQVVGKRGNSDQVICIVANAYEARAKSLSKGVSFTCIGEVENYVKLIGTKTIRVSNAGIR